MFTCISCEVAFVDPALQVKHFQTEWHRYNLKRKIAELPPLLEETYKERFPVQELKEDPKQKTVYCEHCKKVFSNGNSFENHAKSKKHLEKVNTIKDKSTSTKSQEHIDDDEEDEDDGDIEVEEVDSDEWEDDQIPITSCLFCHKMEETFEKNMKHMTLAHSFFIPDIQFCVDLEGLVEYLGEKVGCGLQCLWCNRRSKKFWSLEATKCHMRDKGHCMMKFEGETLVEYSEYYDYSSSYPDADNPNSKPDDPFEIERLCADGYELTLPSGAVIGHRSLLRYYKQRLNPNRNLVLYKEHSSSIHSKMMKHYRSLGWKESSKVEVAKKARDVNFMRQIQARHWMKVGVKGNKLQAHFRPQVMF